MLQDWLFVLLWMHDRMDFACVEHALTAIAKKSALF